VSTRDGSKQGKKPLVGIIMGSDTDLPVMSESAKMLEKFGVPYEIEVTSAHRSPARTHEYASTAVSRRGGRRGGPGGRRRGDDDAAGHRRADGDHGALRH